MKTRASHAPAPGLFDEEPLVPSVPDAEGELREKVLQVHRELCAEYGCPYPYFRVLDPVTELVGSLLSHRTKNKESGRALRNLQEAYPRWEDLIDAPIAPVEELISMVTYPEVKVPAIQTALRTILAERGELSLDFLGEMTPEAAQAWLRRIKGVGPKTAAATLAFSNLKMRALPVDSHHYRVARRLHLISMSVGEGPSHAKLEELLPKEWDAQAVYDHHEILMLHGQRICHWRKPVCDDCVLAEMCPSRGTPGGER